MEKKEEVGWACFEGKFRAKNRVQGDEGFSWAELLA